MGASMDVVEEGDLVTALVFTFSGQPTSLAPSFVDDESGLGPPTLTVNDTLHTVLRERVLNGLSFLQALFQIEVDLQRTDAKYEAETPVEKDKINITAFSYGEPKEQHLHLSYDYFTRAMMAGEQPIDDTYRLFATLASAAREAAFQDRYIDSFRYSFLLLDALFGQGQFKKAGLTKAFKSDPELMAAITNAVTDYREDKARAATPTGIILRDKPSAEIIAEHLIERRGHYFHSNLSKPHAWKPDKQDEARDLAWLCIGINHELAAKYSAPMFEESLGQRHFDSAKKSGAILVLNVNYTFQNNDEETPRKGLTNINIPGTKVTRAMATDVAKNFINDFTERLPAGGLIHAVCVVADTGQPVFEFRLPKNLP